MDSKSGLPLRGKKTREFEKQMKRHYKPIPTSQPSLFSTKLRGPSLSEVVGRRVAQEANTNVWKPPADRLRSMVSNKRIDYTYCGDMTRTLIRNRAEVDRRLSVLQATKAFARSSESSVSLPRATDPGKQLLESLKSTGRYSRSPYPGRRCASTPQSDCDNKTSIPPKDVQDDASESKQTCPVVDSAMPQLPPPRNRVFLPERGTKSSVSSATVGGTKKQVRLMDTPIISSDAPITPIPSSELLLDKGNFSVHCNVLSSNYLFLLI